MRTATLWRSWISALLVMVPVLASAQTVDMFYPSESGYATWAFEDNWPSKGDYDFNDLVVRYRLALRTVNNAATEMRITAAVVARGASFRSGFAISLPIPQSAGALASLGCPGTAVTPVDDGDANHSTYVIIPDTSTVLAAEGCIFFNTDDTEGCNGNGAEFTLTIALPANSGITADTLAMGVNPFIFRVGEPGIEVHLPGFAPTAAADALLFGTKDDATTVVEGAPSGHYYLTATNLPWAIDVPDAWSWPTETTEVVAAYSDFSDWAQSNGRDSPTWFSNPGSFSGTAGLGPRWTEAVSIPSPCTTPGLCHTVVCGNAPECRTGTGTCNPSTGSCQYNQIAADLTVCTGNDLLDGNGQPLFSQYTFMDPYCIAGLCTGECQMGLNLGDSPDFIKDVMRAPHCRAVSGDLNVLANYSGNIETTLLNLETVGSRLYIYQSSGSFSLNKLASVGLLSFTYIDNPITASFPALATVSQYIDFSGTTTNASTFTVNLPALVNSLPEGIKTGQNFGTGNAGNIVVNIPNLTTIGTVSNPYASLPSGTPNSGDITLNLGSVTTIYGNVGGIGGSTGDLTVNLNALTHHTGSFNGGGWSGTATFYCPELVTIDGQISMGGVTGVLNFDMDKLKYVYSGINLGGPYLDNVPLFLDFPELEELKYLTIGGLAGGIALNFPKLLRVTEMFGAGGGSGSVSGDCGLLVNAPLLETIGGTCSFSAFDGNVGVILPSLTQVGGSLNIKNNSGAMTSVNVSALQQVGGDLDIRNNDHLTGVDLGNLTQVGVDVLLVDNPNLCFNYNDLYTSIQPWTNNWTVSGNDPTCYCAGTYVDLQTNTSHCGDCNVTCAVTDSCSEGLCIAP